MVIINADIIKEILPPRPNTLTSLGFSSLSLVASVIDLS